MCKDARSSYFACRGLPALIVLALSASAGWAELRFVQPSVDLGVVHTGPKLVQRYEFINDGPQPVEIIDARTNCGCLRPRLSQSTLQPGEKGWLELQINTLS